MNSILVVDHKKLFSLGPRKEGHNETPVVRGMVLDSFDDGSTLNESGGFSEVFDDAIS